ncbi:hypothetical protein ACIBI4_06025 [Streptomyces sp. NPDC050418]|uniref:hypothetical protein n=1 Tax=Streptomyces sp. NPDC050418 TaxID=3365612 RepID=UPI0037B65A43
MAASSALAHRLAHVRWIAGGTGTGKSTLTRLLAARHGTAVLDGDRAEGPWVARCSPRLHPRLAALRDLPPGSLWRENEAEEVFRSMPSLHGEMTGFLVEDLLELPDDRTVLVDYFGILPNDLAPLLLHPEQAVFLLPTPEFRAQALTSRYADAERSRATWGATATDGMLAKRLARDALWDAEVRRQATDLGLATVTVDGTVPPEDLARRVAARFGLLDDRPTGHRPAGTQR